MIRRSLEIYFFRGVSASLLVASLGISLLFGKADESIVFFNQINIIGSVFSILMTVELGRVFFVYDVASAHRPNDLTRVPAFIYALILLVFICGLSIILKCKIVIILLGVVAGLLISLFNFIAAEVAFSGNDTRTASLVQSAVTLFIAFSCFFGMYYWTKSPNASALIFIFFLWGIVYINRGHLCRVKLALLDTPLFKTSSAGLNKLYKLALVAILAIAIVQLPRYVLNQHGGQLLVLISYVVIFISAAFESIIVSQALKDHVAKPGTSSYSITAIELQTIFFAPFLSTSVTFLLLWGIYGVVVDIFLGIIYLTLEFSRYCFTVGANGIGVASSRSRLILMCLSCCTIVFAILFLNLSNS